MKRMWGALCLATFVIGLVAFSQTQRDDIEPARSFVVVTAHFRINADGSRTDLGSRMLHAKTNGELRQSKHDANNATDPNKQSPAVARTEEGVFSTAPGASDRKLISTTAVPLEMQECFRSNKCLNAAPTLVRTEELAGLRVYVLHDNIPAPHPMEWIEQSYSPKTGYLALRTIRHMRDGSEDILEATSVEFKDVPDELNDDIKACQSENRELTGSRPIQGSPSSVLF